MSKQVKPTPADNRHAVPSQIEASILALGRLLLSLAWSRAKGSRYAKVIALAMSLLGTAGGGWMGQEFLGRGVEVQELRQALQEAQAAVAAVPAPQPAVKPAEPDTDAEAVIDYMLTRSRLARRDLAGYYAIFQQEAKPRQVPLLLAIAEVESSFDHTARSLADGQVVAVGLCGIHAKVWGDALQAAGIIDTVRDLYDPEVNVRAAIHILWGDGRYMEGAAYNTTRALQAYCLGPEGAKRAPGKSEYAERVYAAMGRIMAASAPRPAPAQPEPAPAPAEAQPTPPAPRPAKPSKSR